MTRFARRSLLWFALGAVALTAALLVPHAGLPAVSPPLTVAGLGLAAWAAAGSPRFRGLAFTLWVLTFAASAWFYPRLYIWPGSDLQPKQLILPLVQVIMFGMGVTL